MRDGAALPLATAAKPQVTASRASARFSTAVGRAGSGKQMWVVLGGVLAAAVLLIVGFNVYSAWDAGQRQAAYAQGVQALGERNYETAVSDLKRAGDYLDARARLDDAQKHLGDVVQHYDRAIAAQRSGLSWDAAYEFRQAIELDPRYQDAADQLAQARKKIGRLLWTTSAGGTSGATRVSSVWTAPADGGGAKEIASGGLNGWRLFGGKGMVLVAGDANRQTLYASDLDGVNRKEVVSADTIELGWPSGVSSAGAASRVFAIARDKGTAGNPRQTLYTIDVPGGGRKELLSADQITFGGITADSTSVLAIVQSGTNPKQALLLDPVAGTQTEVARPGADLAAALSPDGKSVYYSYSEVDNRGQIFHTALSHIGQDDRVDLGDAAKQPTQVRFSDDGRLLGLVVSRRDTSQLVFEIADVQTGGRADVIQSPKVQNWVHTPDAHKLFVAVTEGDGASARSVVYQFDENGQGRVEIASGQSADLATFLYRGRVLMWIQEKNRSLSSAVFVDGDGSNRYDLGSSAPGDRVYPILSGDGKRAAVVLTDPTRSQSDSARLMVYDLSSASAPVQVAAGAHLSAAGWSPDNTRLAYTQTGGGAQATSTLYIADVSAKTPPIKLVDSVSSIWSWYDLPPITS